MNVLFLKVRTFDDGTVSISELERALNLVRVSQVKHILFDCTPDQDFIDQLSITVWIFCFDKYILIYTISFIIFRKINIIQKLKLFKKVKYFLTLILHYKKLFKQYEF